MSRSSGTHAASVLSPVYYCAACAYNVFLSILFPLPFFLFYFSFHTSSPLLSSVVSFPVLLLVPLFLSLSLFPLAYSLSTGERASEYEPSEMTTVARVPRDTLCLRIFLSTEVRSCTCAHSCTACAWKSDAEGGGGSVKRAARTHTYACALLCSRHCRCHTRLSSPGIRSLRARPSIILHLIPRTSVCSCKEFPCWEILSRDASLSEHLSGTNYYRRFPVLFVSS